MTCKICSKSTENIFVCKECLTRDDSVILGIAGEDLQPGDTIIRGADRKFYKSKQKE